MLVRDLVIHPDFVHRVNDNGSVDSICLYCFATVASFAKEIGLEERESAHGCVQRFQRTNATAFGRESGSPAIFRRRSRTS